MDIGMSLKNKVIWSEGMFLQQQHFQQQDRFFERLVDSRITSAGHYLWGVQDLVLDVEALTLGKVSLSSVSGIFPDGTPISVPELEEPPAIINIPENTRDEVVYLCIPMKQPGGQEFARKEEEVPQARYQVLNYEAWDRASSSGWAGRRQVGELGVCFKLRSADLGGDGCIGIGRILGRFAGKPGKLEKDFRTPLLDCS